jgi:uncharacterized protein (TIGR02246 family)
MTDDTAELLALEERAWEANRNGDADWYEERLTGDAIVVSRWGVAERDAILEGFAANRNPYLRTTTDDQRVLRPTPDTAVVTGRTVVEVLMEGQSEVTEHTVRSSTLYVREGGAWKIAFHQQTQL